jgi:hypothetical protein
MNSTSDPLKLSDIASLTLETAGFINEVWGFYITVILALVGWLVTIRTSSSRSNFETVPRVIIMIGFTVFAAINWDTLYISQEKLNLVQKLAVSVAQGQFGSSQNEQYQMITQIFKETPGISVRYIHPLVDMLVIWAIWLLTAHRKSKISNGEVKQP